MTVLAALIPGLERRTPRTPHPVSLAINGGNKRGLARLLLLVWLPVTAWSAQTSITGWEVTPRELTFGEAALLRVEGTGLRELDHAFLSRDFIVELASHGISGAEVLELRLHPRRAGWLVVPPPPNQSALQSIALMVHPDTERHVSSGVERPDPWVRQPLRLWVDLYTTRRNPLAEPEGAWSANWHLQRLPDQLREEQRDGQLWHVKRLQWEAMPLRDGVMSVEPPPLRLGGRRLLPVPPLRIEVRPLPRHIPTWVQVGTLTVEALPLPQYVSRGEPFARSFVVSGRSLLPGAFIPVLDDAQRGDGQHRYPFEVSVEDSADPALNRYRVTLTTVPQESGTRVLPPLYLPFVDESGRLAVVEIPGGTVQVRHPMLRTAMVSLLVVLVLFTVAGLIIRLRPALQRRLARRAICRQLESADSVEALALFLRQWPVDGQARPQTLRRWLKRWRQTPPPDLESVVQDLEQARWRRKDGESPSLRQALLRALRKAV